MVGAMSDGGYWVDSPDNPFNQMSYTRGGGGYDNSSTHESNAARAHAMQGAGASALPHFATRAVAQKVLPAGSLAVVGGTTVVKTSGAGASTGQVGTAAPGKGGTGPGVAVATTGGGGKRSGSRLVIATPENRGAYKSDFDPGLLVWEHAEQFVEAPVIGGIENVPLERIGIGGAQEAPGAISDIGWARTATGYVPVPGGDMKERIEDNFFMETSWFVRNYLAPMFVEGQERRPDFLDPKYSHYAPIANEWREGGPLINGRRTGGGF